MLLEDEMITHYSQAKFEADEKRHAKNRKITEKHLNAIKNDRERLQVTNALPKLEKKQK